VILDCMDILKMLAELRAERQQIEDAIGTIERFAVRARTKGRGRLLKSASALTEETVAAATFSTRGAVSSRARKQITGKLKKRAAAKKALTPSKPQL
jgi:hypothetical protein